MSTSGVNRWTKAIRQFWKHRATLGKDTVKCIGKDQLGNVYYEAYRPNNIRPIQRYFEKPSMKNFDDVVSAANVPPLWDAWLRFRRQEPPSDEEIKDSEEYYRMQQDMATSRMAQEQAKAEPDAAVTAARKTKKVNLASIYTDKHPR